MEMRFVVQTSSHLLPRVVMRIKKMHCVAYGCKTRSLILLSTLEYLTRAAQIPGAISPSHPNFVWRGLIYVGSQYETCFMSPLWRLEF
jgi:hypothetical protein